MHFRNDSRDLSDKGIIDFTKIAMVQIISQYMKECKQCSGQMLIRFHFRGG